MKEVKFFPSNPIHRSCYRAVQRKKEKFVKVRTIKPIRTKRDPKINGVMFLKTDKNIFVSSFQLTNLLITFERVTLNEKYMTFDMTSLSRNSDQSQNLINRTVYMQIVWKIQKLTMMNFTL